MFDLKTVYDNGKGTYFLAFESGDMLEFVMTDMGEEKKSHMTAGIRHLAFSLDDGKFMPMVEKMCIRDRACTAWNRRDRRSAKRRRTRTAARCGLTAARVRY